MISIDTNILFFGFAEDRAEHNAARKFLEDCSERTDVVLSAFVLAELYRLLRNPVVLEKPLNAREAADVARLWRAHPRWRVAGFPADSAKVHDELWKLAAREGFAARRIFDARLALVLREFGVKEFATANVKDFLGCGFQRVWNPVAAG